MVALDTATFYGALYMGGFGVTLYAEPAFFYGKGGVMPYFNNESSFMSQFNGRGFGSRLMALAAGHFLAPGDKTVAKMMSIASVSMLPVIVQATFGGDPGAVEFMWKAQVV